MNTHDTICLLNDSFPPQIDGVANAVCNYARCITAQDGRAVVITPQYPDADDSGWPYPVLRYPSIDLREKTGYFAGIPFSPELAGFLEGEKVSLLHSHCPVISTFMARQLRQITDAPLVLTYHTKFDIDIANVIHSRLLQEGSRKILLENINACDEVWTVSHGAGENLRSLGYSGGYVVMPNGVDTPRQRLSRDEIASVTGGYDLPEDIPVFLFVGRIMWYKGLRLLLDALAGLAAAGENFRMVFVGSGGDFDEVRAYAAQCGLTPMCVFTGAVQDRQALRAWYCRADLFLFPSTFDTNGLVVREAAACSLPAVLIRGSCAAEDVTDGRNGFLVEENAQSLRDCLLRLLRCRPQLRQVGENAARELYISWEQAVSMARERYGVVIDRYKSGSYPPCRKPVEYFLKANGELMEDLGHLARLRDQLRQHVRDRFDF